MFSWDKLQKRFVGLAPMAGYTDSPFRRICKEMGADVLYSELISATALHYNLNDEKTLKLCSFSESERPFVLQFFGSNPEHFISAIKAIESAGIKPDGIDINMGCPAPKVVKAGYGSVLMREVSQATEIIKEIKKNFSYPVSVKTRSGWDSVTAPEFAKELEKAGADAICIHARTYKQAFTGQADWSVIKAVKEAVKMPVIGNGDVKSREDIYKMFAETDCDGVLIGRAALGNPWIFQKYKIYKTKNKIEDVIPNPVSAGEESLDSSSQTPQNDIKGRSFGEVITVLLKHIDYAEEFYGAEKAGKEMRKHYGFCLRGIEGTKELRSKLVLENDLEKVKKLLKNPSF